MGVGGYMMLLEEQVYAYRIIDALRAWLELQPLKVMTLEALIYAVIETMLQDKYWKTQMRSLSAVAKYAVRTAQDVYRTAKLEKDKEATQLRRILNANNNQLAVDYD